MSDPAFPLLVALFALVAVGVAAYPHDAKLHAGRRSPRPSATRG
ncbi:MAG TPA: hypothetical protein VFQ40_02605 [Actinomycetota bacterium]|nr:hypothetical protein [Actinomycetota bacterium]